jgi:signal peptidase I
MHAIDRLTGRHAGFSAIVVDALARGVAVRFRAEGESMYPAIRSGEIIHVAPLSSDDVRIGDVLLCRQGSRVLVHRLVAITNPGEERHFHLRGDAKGGCDRPISATDIIGRVDAVYRDAREIRLDAWSQRIRHRVRRGALHLRARVAAISVSWRKAVSVIIDVPSTQ